MTSVRVIDEIGNRHDYEADAVPRIGERIVLEYGVGGNAIREHCFRVRDVMYRLDAKSGTQVAILVEEELEPERWPS